VGIGMTMTMGKMGDCDRDFNQLDDAVLAHLLASGQHEALAVLFARYRKIIFNIAQRIVRDNGEAEDVVQQVFLEVFRYISRFDHNKGSFTTWILQYAYHRSLNRRDHLKANRFYCWDDLCTYKEPINGYNHGLHMSKGEIDCLVRELLTTLEPHQKHVLELSYFLGLTATEIAQQTGATVGIVRHNVARGRSKLRAALTLCPEKLR
jgi:RNA polymerase sigma-70 factor, ECF subfamily